MAIKKGKNNANKGNNENDYDSLNPEAVNPNVKKAGKQLANFAKKIAKAIGKAIRKIIELLIKLGPVGIIILVILLIVVIIIAFFSMPGMMRDKLLSLFKINWDWLKPGAVQSLDNQDIIDVANYIEEMGYSLVGDGFVTPIIGSNQSDYKSIEELREQYKYREDEKRFYDENGQVVSISYYDLTGKLIDNTTGEPVNGEVFTDKYGIERVVSEDGKNKLILPDGDKDAQTEYLESFSLIRSYLLSNYRIYTLKNNDENTLQSIYAALKTISGNRDAWAKGLLKIYMAKDGYSDRRWSGEVNLFDHFEINETTLSLKAGIGNRAMDYSIEGWAPRYGMNLDFLISLHLGTNAPDLVYAMLQNFDTEVQVYLDESGNAKVQGSYVDPNYRDEHGNLVTPDKGVTFDDLNTAISNNNAFAGFVFNDVEWLQGIDNKIIDNKMAQAILRACKIESLTYGPYACTGVGQAFYIESGSFGSDTGDDLWNGEMSYLESVGITEEVDPDVYGLNDRYSYLTYGDSGGEEFNLENLSIRLDPSEYNYDSVARDDYFTLNSLEDVINEDGFTGEMAEPTIEEFDLYKSHESVEGWDEVSDLENDRGNIVGNTSFNNMPGTFKLEDGYTVNLDDFVDVGTKYKVKKVVNYNTWSSDTSGTINDPNGEFVDNVDYEWVSYKYVLYPYNNYVRQPKEYIDITDEVAHPEGTRVYKITQWEEAIVGPQLNGAGGSIEDIIMLEFIIRPKTEKELEDYLDENGDLDLSLGKCSSEEQSKCCDNCRDYVRMIVDAVSTISDPSYKTYTPYIARVVGSWFRDTYFIIPKNEPDYAIKNYAGKSELEDENGKLSSTSRPEFDMENTYTITGDGSDLQFVKVDEEYLGDTGEYWTDYERKINDDGTTGDYQLFLLLPDGTTSDIKMEDFLKDPKINGVQAQIGGKNVSPYIDGGADINDEETIKLGKEKAEKDGWAFVKKAKLVEQNVLDQTNNAAEQGADESHIYWSAYKFTANNGEAQWMRVNRKYEDIYDENGNVTRVEVTDPKIKLLYDTIYGPDIDDTDGPTGIFYLLDKTNSVTQTEDAYRGPTNPLVKYLFKYRKFYIYDGNENRALAIEHDKKRILYGYDNYCREYDTEKEFYNGKVLADNDIIDVNDIINWRLNNGGIQWLKSNGNVDGSSFYKFRGLIDTEGNGILLAQIYSDNWQEIITQLLNNYGRSAIRQSYSWATNTKKLDIENLASQWLDWQLDMYYMAIYGVDLMDYYNIEGGKTITWSDMWGNTKSYRINSNEDLLKLDFDPRDPDLINTVAITKSSLSAFTILENTNTLDADYAYRDLKELIVELDYFDKEELSEKIPQVFTWVFEGQDKVSWPVRPYDKADSDYGILIHSKDTYNDLKEYMKDQGIEINDEELIEESERETSSSGTEVDGVVDISDFEGYNNDDMVLSPVTGKVLEIGKHDRMNIYTNQMENVGFIIIEVTEVPNRSAGGNDDLNLFYREYTGVCEGYTIMIDGIDVDLSGDGFYEQNRVYGIANTQELAERKEIEARKEAAPFVLNLTGSSSVPTYGYEFKGNAYEGYFIKEGKYIGKAVAKGVNKTPVVTSSTIPDTEEKVTFNYDDYSGKTDYIRIIMKDTGYAIVDNVEDFFDPERNQKEDSGSTDSATAGAETYE